MDTETTLNTLDGIIAQKERELEAFKMSRAAVAGTLNTQLTELEAAKERIAELEAEASEDVPNE